MKGKMKAAEKVDRHKVNGKGANGMAGKPFPASEPVAGKSRASLSEEIPILDKSARKQEKKAMKALRKAERKAAGHGKKAAKVSGSPFPIIELIDEQVRSNIPAKLVAKVN